MHSPHKTFPFVLESIYMRTKYIRACVKIINSVFAENDKKLVIRTCSIPNMESFDVCAKLKGEGGVSVCETCEKDGCNGASSAVPSSLLVLLSAALVAYLFAAKQ